MLQITILFSFGIPWTARVSHFVLTHSTSGCPVLIVFQLTHTRCSHQYLLSKHKLTLKAFCFQQSGALGLLVRNPST